MKKLLLLTLLSATVIAAKANVIKIKVVDFQFKAKTVNAVVGDTIQWIWKEGIHTTTSTSVPGAAKTWDKPLDSAHRKFMYVVRVAGTYKYKCTFHASLGMKGTINVSAALAPGLQDFSVAGNDGNAILSWHTLAANGIAYFSVQRSTNGDDFAEIGRVSPQQANQYEFRDNARPSVPFLYYQVEMVDVHGNRQLSEIKMYTVTSAHAQLVTSISPNPVSNPAHLMLQFNADKEGTLLVQLYNQAGMFVKQTQMTAYKGVNNGHFHLGDLNPGTYYLVCSMNGIQEKHTIIVR